MSAAGLKFFEFPGNDLFDFFIFLWWSGTQGLSLYKYPITDSPFQEIFPLQGIDFPECYLFSQFTGCSFSAFENQVLRRTPAIHKGGHTDPSGDVLGTLFLPNPSGRYSVINKWFPQQNPHTVLICFLIPLFFEPAGSHPERQGDTPDDQAFSPKDFHIVLCRL